MYTCTPARRGKFEPSSESAHPLPPPPEMQRRRRKPEASCDVSHQRYLRPRCLPFQFPFPFVRWWSSSGFSSPSPFILYTHSIKASFEKYSPVFNGPVKPAKSNRRGDGPAAGPNLEDRVGCSSGTKSRRPSHAGRLLCAHARAQKAKWSRQPREVVENVWWHKDSRGISS